MPLNFEVPIDAQIAAVEREIEMRQKVYPTLVEAHRMSQSRADAEIEQMRAVLLTLRRVERGISS
jgi:hypothetical protein